MRVPFFKTFFVPLAVVVFLLSLTSCGKDHDLVSDFVVRDPALRVQVQDGQRQTAPEVALTDKIPTLTEQKNRKAYGLK